MKNKKSLHAFTLIELAVVFAIIAIMAGLAVNSLFGSMPRIRLRGDIWDVNQALTNARMRAISENSNFGVAFYRQGTAPNYTYYYFIFRDANSDNSFTDLDGNPLVQCEAIGEIVNGTACTISGEDPIDGGRRVDPGTGVVSVTSIVHTLNPVHFFAEIFGDKFSTPVRSIVFNSPMGTPNCQGNINCGDIIIQSSVILDRDLNNSYAGRLRINPATGTVTRIPIERRVID